MPMKKRPITRAAIVGHDGTMLALVDTDLPSGAIEYAWEAQGYSLINPCEGTLSRAKKFINVPFAYIWENKAECIYPELRRFLITTFQREAY